MQIVLTRNTEIRHLSIQERNKLAQCLANSWKKLMSILPKILTNSEEYDESYGYKYTADHIRLIEEASSQNNIVAVDILFEEWGTSGKIRPTLGHLLSLLIKAHLLRAADYVAIDLLKETQPRRPSRGPAAKIHISLYDDEHDNKNNIDGDNDIENENSIPNNKQNQFVKKDLELLNKINVVDSERDLMVFSSTKLSGINQVVFSDTQKSIKTNQSENSHELNLSKRTNSFAKSSNRSEKSTAFFQSDFDISIQIIPNISELNLAENRHFAINDSLNESISAITPRFSALQFASFNSNSITISNVSQNIKDNSNSTSISAIPNEISSNLPNFSALQMPNNTNDSSSNISHNSLNSSLIDDLRSADICSSISEIIPCISMLQNSS